MFCNFAKLTNVHVVFVLILNNHNALSSSIQKSGLKFQAKTTDGWDDFDIDNPEESNTEVKSKEPSPKEEKQPRNKDNVKSQDTGWDDFDDWGQDDVTSKNEMVTIDFYQPPQKPLCSIYSTLLSNRAFYKL